MQTSAPDNLPTLVFLCCKSVKLRPQPQDPESRINEMGIQDVEIEADPHAGLPRGLVLICESERYLLSYPKSTLSQTGKWGLHHQSV